MGKSTISMAIFNCYVAVHQRVPQIFAWDGFMENPIEMDDGLPSGKRSHINYVENHHVDHG